MIQPASNPYLKTKIMTASPDELRLMLYDGAIKFCHQAHKALHAKDYEASYNALMRSQKIVLELSTSLNHDVAPEICEKLSALYTYIYRLLIDANMQRQIEPVTESIELLEYERDTWKLLMKKVTESGEGASSVDAAQKTAIGSLSING